VRQVLREQAHAALSSNRQHVSRRGSSRQARGNVLLRRWRRLQLLQRALQLLLLLLLLKLQGCHEGATTAGARPLLLLRLWRRLLSRRGQRTLHAGAQVLQHGAAAAAAATGRRCNSGGQAGQWPARQHQPSWRTSSSHT
jgi:hypothetical protein